MAKCQEGEGRHAVYASQVVQKKRKCQKNTCYQRVIVLDKEHVGKVWGGQESKEEENGHCFDLNAFAVSF